MIFYDEDKIPEEIDGINVIQDITIAVDCLSKGQTIARYEFGDSMKPILTSGQFCKLIPFKKDDEIKQGDCVFALVEGSIGTHMVWMVSESNDRKFYCIATTEGHVIGWTDTILAKAYGMPYSVNSKIYKTKFNTTDFIGSTLRTTTSSRYGYRVANNSLYGNISNVDLPTLADLEENDVDLEEDNVDLPTLADLEENDIGVYLDSGSSVDITVDEHTIRNVSDMLNIQEELSEDNPF